MRNKIFISYCHDDCLKENYETDYISEFLEFIKPFKRKDLLSVFHDSDISGGQKWHHEIQEAIHATKVAVLIISQRYLNSSYIREHELVPLLEAEARGEVVVIPLFLGLSGVDQPLNALSIAQPNGSLKEVSLADYEGFNAPSEPLNRTSLGGREMIYKQASERLEQLMSEIPHSMSTQSLALTRSFQEDDTALNWKNGALVAKLSFALRDKYKIKRELHSGKDTVVLRGWDILLNRPIAIKTWRLTSKEKLLVASSSGMSSGVLKKLQFAAYLTHSRIITVYAAGIFENICYIILEYVPGISLERLILSTGIQPYRRTKRYIQHIGEALIYAHNKGFFHHHLDTTNILIDQDGIPMISPFRMSSEFHEKSVTMDDTELKSVKYQTPEQWENKEITEASDQYSLGLIAYEMIQGELLFNTKSSRDLLYEKDKFIQSPPALKDIRPDCPDDLSRIVFRMLQRNPDKRYPSLREALKAWEIAQLPTYREKSSSQWKDYERCKESYDRCRQSPHFFREFYNRFFVKQPNIRGMFPENLEDQYRILREALELLLLYPIETPIGGQEPNILSKMAKRHAGSAWSLDQTMYDIFVCTLLETVDDYDPEYAKNRTLAQSWASTLAQGIAYMKSHLLNPQLTSGHHK